MDSGMPLISVIMPAYNAGQFIERAIKSVLAQTVANWELIVVDDASTDDTVDIVRSFSDSRIVLKTCEHKGYPAAVRNVGLRLAKGELIAFLDADDWYFSDCLENLFGALKDKPQAIGVYGFAVPVDEKGAPLLERGMIGKERDGGWMLNGEYSDGWNSVVLGKISCVVSALMIRRETVNSVGLFNEQLYGVEDYEFYVRLLLRGQGLLVCLERPVFFYQHNPAGLTKRSDGWRTNVSDGLAVVEWIYSRSELKGQITISQSEALVAHYRYYIRERVLVGQTQIARQLIWMAFRDMRIHRTDWIGPACLLFLRSLLSVRANGVLVKWRNQLRRRFR